MSLVGRDDALAQVAALRTSAGYGSFAALVIEGEAGIGKTALAEAAARAAVGRWLDLGLGAGR
jgi:MoxR-like ATPase